MHARLTSTSFTLHSDLTHQPLTTNTHTTHKHRLYTPPRPDSSATDNKHTQTTHKHRLYTSQRPDSSATDNKHMHARLTSTSFTLQSDQPSQMYCYSHSRLHQLGSIASAIPPTVTKDVSTCVHPSIGLSVKLVHPAK